MEVQLKSVQEQAARNTAKIEQNECAKVGSYAAAITTPMITEKIWPSLGVEEQHQRQRARQESSNRTQLNKPQTPYMPRSLTQTDTGWMEPKQQRRQRIREAAKEARVVTGSGSNTGLQCGISTKVIFVYHVNNSYTTENIKTTMKQAGAEPVHIRQTSHAEAANKSFKVVIKEDDLDKIMDPGFWEEGIMCREWIN